MQPVSPTATRYNGTTMFFHWAVAILVAAQWLGAQTIDWFPRGPLRVDAKSFHIVFGLVLAVLLIGRVVWRLTKGRRLPPAGEGILQAAAKAAHWGLYLLVGAMLLAGIGVAWAQGISLFNLIPISAYDPGNRALAHQIQDIHAAIGWIIVAVAGLHASAALAHRYIWHDGILGRMLPRG